MLTCKNIVYVLIDPRTGEFRYIGMTKFGILRPKKHTSSAKCGEKSHKANWINQLQTLGLEYEIGVLEKLSDETKLPKAEMKWISCYRGMGARLTNATDGGEGTLNPSDETRVKMSAAAKGRIITMAQRRKQSAAMKGKPSPMKGKKFTATHRIRLSKAAKRRFSDPKERAKISAARTGEKHPMFGKQLPPETKARMRETALSQNRKGWNHTPEAKAKISEASKRYWARQRKETARCH